MYDDHLRLIGKRVVYFLLVSIELFSLRVTAEVLRAIICSKSAISLRKGSVDPKFQVEGVAPSTNHSFSQKTRTNDHGIKMCRFVTMHAFDGQTDGQTERQNYYR